MADYTYMILQANYGNDSTPSWEGLSFGGTGGADEIRWTSSTGGATGSTGSGVWPGMQIPTVTEVVPQAWAFSSDTVGQQVQYDGTGDHLIQFRWNWDTSGTFASPPRFSAFSDSNLYTPVPGATSGWTPGTQSGAPIVNGTSVDTSNTSYLKANAFGYGLDSGGSLQYPTGNPSTGLSVTSGTANGVSPASDAWLTNWQSLQGWLQFIINGTIPKGTTAGSWYFLLSLYTGPNMLTGLMQPVLVLQYAYT